MGAVYDWTEKEYYHNKRHRCACRDTGILLPNYRQGQLLPDAVFLSAQLYLYRPVRHLGAFCPPADRAKAGMQIYDGHCGASYHLDGNPFGEVFYILAAGRRPLPVASVLSAHAVCAYAGAADCHVAGEAGRMGYDSATTSPKGASRTTLQWDSGVGTEKRHSEKTA